MNILAIETTGKYGSAAVIKDDGSIFSASSHEEMNHLKGIISVVDEAVRSAGISKDELTHIAASVGPGSFTGIRIGVTTARTMAQMLKLPCISVSSLAAMAFGAADAAEACGARLVVPVINARRHQTYAAVYEADLTSVSESRMPEAVMEEKQYMIEDLIAELSARLSNSDGSRAFFTGDGIDAYSDIIKNMLPAGSYVFAGEEERYQTAGPVAALALIKAEAGGTISYDQLMPEYMRLAEAEQRLRAGTLSDKIRRPQV